MSNILSPFTTSIGRKVIMAVTGMIWLLYIFVHMLGNLQIYLGPEAINAYGDFLHHFLHGSVLWVFRIGLISTLVLHLWAAITLTLENWKARPQGYKKSYHVASNYASRTMIWSGPILGFFIVYHVLHLTTGQANPGFIEGDVYHNVVYGFSSLPVSAFYIVAMLLLGFHLYHGGWSMLQTLGAENPRCNSWAKALAAIYAVIVVIGNCSIPLSILTGIVK
jgi:succinate dehydrogenase / fumarate reductase cytochrome b subunit